ncbi:YjdF family protein [Actinoallomurus sp. NBC_01490]|uniref:DUF2992 family protein n=1 Tax=Actinoallomurus sp. NBC_01490 TaxID=2903557 RepID=UPI002E333CE7|nr:DUF2992 family protein [Actinoallomurus sp. NBC_01490]
MSAVTLTVCLEDPFRVGILEVDEDGQVRATRVVFGAAKPAAREAARGAPCRRATASQEAVRLKFEERKAQASADARARKATDVEHRYEATRAKRRKRRRGH